MTNRSEKTIVISFLLAVLAWSVLLYFVKPAEIVNLIGISNSYAAIFIIALLGGASTFTTTTTYAAVITLALGGVNIFALSLVAGAGATLGDGIFFYFGMKGRQYVYGRLEKIIKEIALWFRQRSHWFLPLAVYLYSGFAPTPNGIMILTLAVSGYHYKKIFLPNLLGNATFMLLLSLFAKGTIRL
jgi:membrane protein YqaA with SNARE-associated domain